MHVVPGEQVHALYHRAVEGALKRHYADFAIPVFHGFEDIVESRHCPKIHGAAEKPHCGHVRECSFRAEKRDFQRLLQRAGRGYYFPEYGAQMCIGKGARVRVDQFLKVNAFAYRAKYRLTGVRFQFSGFKAALGPAV
jgi:hypothetical protein